MTGGHAEVNLTAHTSSLRGIAEQYVEVTQKYEGMESRLNSIEDLLRQVSVYIVTGRDDGRPQFWT
jgi:hypothetical protein